MTTIFQKIASNWPMPPSTMKNIRIVLSMCLLTLTALFAGTLPALVPWFIVVGLCLGAIYFVVLCRWPAIGISVYLCLILVAPDFKIADVVSVLVIGALVLRQIAKGHPLKLKEKRLSTPLLSFLFIGLVSLLLAISVFKNQVPLIYRDGRVFVYWLWLPLLVAMIQTNQLTQTSIKRIIIFFALFISIITLLQGATGIQITAVGRVADLDGSGATTGGITRVQLPGFIFVSFSFIWLLGSLTINPKRLSLTGILIIILAAAIYLNLGRALWAWTFIALILLVFILGRTRGLALTGVLFAGGIMAFASVYTFKPAVIEIMVNRITSIQDEGGNRTSYGWRKWENEDAIRRIIQTPIVGVGVGGEYRQWISELRVFEDHTRYVHNTFLFYSLKLGIPGLLAMLWLLSNIWWFAFKHRQIGVEIGSDGFNAAAAAFLPAMMGLSFTQPDLAGPFGALFISLVAASLSWIAITNHDSAASKGNRK